MGEFFTVENILTLFMLIMLQAVLGFDNLLYISLESKRAPEDRRRYVQRMGIGLAIALRIGLLFLLTSLIGFFQEPVLPIHWTGVIEANANVHSLIVLGGGAFILYTAIKEIWHMIALEKDDQHEKKTATVGKVIAMIVIMNVVFSFDSILSAMALTTNFWTMAVAIVISGILMMWLSDRVSTFLQKNRMYEVLGLFILFLVGVMLLTEGGHLAHLELFGSHIEAMSKTTFYFVLVVLVLVDVVQGRYQKKLSRTKAKEQTSAE